MNLRATLEENQGKIIQTANSLFDCEEDLKPTFEWGDSNHILLKGRTYSLDLNEGKIQLNMAGIVDEFRSFVKKGYKLDEKHFLAYIVSKPLSHYYHYLTKKQDMENIGNYIQNLQLDVENRNLEGVIKGMRPLAYHLAYLDSIGSGGRNLIEKEVDLLDQKMHDFINRVNEKDIKEDWEKYYNIILKMNESKFKNLYGKDLIHKLNALGKFVLIYFSTSNFSGEIVGNDILKNGTEYLRKLIKVSDYSITNRTLDELNKKIHPGMGIFEEKLAELLLGTFGGWTRMIYENGSIMFRYKSDLLNPKAGVVLQ